MSSPDNQPHHIVTPEEQAEINRRKDPLNELIAQHELGPKQRRGSWTEQQSQLLDDLKEENQADPAGALHKIAQRGYHGIDPAHTYPVAKRIKAVRHRGAQ